MSIEEKKGWLTEDEISMIMVSICRHANGPVLETDIMKCLEEATLLKLQYYMWRCVADGTLEYIVVDGNPHLRMPGASLEPEHQP